MKVAIITDTHFGARQDSEVFLDHTKKFFGDCFFPYCIENKIKHVIHMGDVFDRPNQVSYKTLQAFQDTFYASLDYHGIGADIIMGNHDCFHKNIPDINAIRSIYSPFNWKGNIRFHWNPEVIILDGATMALVPWPTTDKMTEVVHFIENTKADYLFGHLEIQTFSFEGSGKANEHGFKPEAFRHYRKAFSGHFHNPQTSANIVYTGAPYQLTWGDCDKWRGFVVLDTETGEIERIENPVKVFHNIQYGESTDHIGAGSFVYLTLPSGKMTATLRRQSDKLVEALEHRGAKATVIEPQERPEPTMTPLTETPEMIDSIRNYVGSLTEQSESRRACAIGIMESAYKKAMKGN
jgi:DNA repair exonuclease SbcCD nuclease subunit